MNMQVATSHKYARFGRGSVELASRNNEPLPLDDIAKLCPSVLAETSHDSRSDRYTFISTYDILRGLGREGFHPHFIMQGGSKDENKRSFTKHLIRFRSENSNAIAVGGSVYEVCLLNSHDGSTSQQMFGGFFRFACKNGTIFFDGAATAFKLPHKGNVLDKVIDGAFTVVQNGKLARDHVDNFQSITVNHDERMAFATAAATLRFDDESPIQPERLLDTRRVDDRGSDLWSMFNVVQENTLRGGIGYTADNGRGGVTNRHTRPVRSVDGDVKLNRALWTLAEEMAKIKTR